MTEREKLKREIYVLGQIVDAHALAFASKTMNDDNRELLQRQMSVGTAHQKLLEQRLDRPEVYSCFRCRRRCSKVGRSRPRVAAMRKQIYAKPAIVSV